MENIKWQRCLQACRMVLGRGAWNPMYSQSWCAFTTFSSLGHGVNYWKCGFPEVEELLETHTADGGLWRQVFHYQDIAHLIVPFTFFYEETVDGTYQSGTKRQDVLGLSQELKKLEIDHRVTDLVLEMKLY